MFTNEIDWDESITTVMDESNTLEDVKLFIDDNEVIIQQWNEPLQRYDMVILTHGMWGELLAALNEGEGAFIIKKD